MHSQRGILETKHGKVEWALTDGRHVHMGTTHSATVNTGHMTLRKVAYHVSHHLFLQEDGSWAMKKDDRIYVSRTDMRDASDPAKRDIRKVLESAWAKFIDGKDHLLVAAEKEHIEEEMESLQEKKAKLKKELSTLQCELGFMEADLVILSTTRTLPEKREPVYTR